MQNWSFKGFSSSGAAIPVPDLFFSEVLPRITDINELKTALYVYWLIKHKRGYPRFVTVDDLMQDALFTKNIGIEGKSKRELLEDALELGVSHGILLKTSININGLEKEAIFFNIEPDRTAYQKLVNGEIKAPAGVTAEQGKKTDLKNIYTLYEQNIGLITPIVAEELKKAEEEYPEEWINEAFRNAVEMNRRNWRYISRILEIWSAEGKDNGKIRGYTKKDKDSGKYVRGKYGHMVNR